MASKKMWLGKRLRGPLVAVHRRHGDAGLFDVRRRRGEVELVGRRVGGAGHLVVAEAIGRRVAVGAADVDAEQVVRLRHDVDDRHADVGELQARVADRAAVASHWLIGTMPTKRAAGHGHDVAVVDRVPAVARHVERVDGVDVVVEVAAGLRVAEAVDVLDRGPVPAVPAVPSRWPPRRPAGWRDRGCAPARRPGCRCPRRARPRWPASAARRVDGRDRVQAVARIVERAAGWRTTASA